MTRILTNAEIERLVNVADCLDALEVAFRDSASGAALGTGSRIDTVLPSTHEGVSYEFTSMEGAIPALGVMALRCLSYHVATRVVAGVPRKERLLDPPGGGPYTGLILLFSLADRRLLGILQDGFISPLRVGATNALAARALARPDAGVVGLLGSGTQARAQLLGLAAVRPLREVRVFSPNEEHRRAFAQEMTESLGVPVQAARSAYETVRGADLVVAATNALEPAFDVEWVEPGAHVTSLQSADVPPGLYGRADRLVIAIKSGFGRGQAGMYDDAAAWDTYPTLGELLAGRAVGRTDERQVTYFANNGGVGFQFAAVGARVLEAAQAQGVGQELPDELFLQTSR